jgi:hypothetical protein
MTDNVNSIIVQHIGDELEGREPTIFEAIPETKIDDRSTIAPPKNYEIDFVLETAR